MSDLAAELASLDRLGDRISTTSNDKLGDILRILLPKLIGLMNKEELRGKIFSILNSQLKRIRSLQDCKLPLDSLLALLRTEHLPFACNFAMTFIDIGWNRQLKSMDNPSVMENIIRELCISLCDWAEYTPQSNALVRYCTAVIPHIAAYLKAQQALQKYDSTTKEEKESVEEKKSSMDVVTEPDNKMATLSQQQIQNIQQILGEAFLDIALVRKDIIKDTAGSIHEGLDAKKVARLCARPGSADTVTFAELRPTKLVLIDCLLEGLVPIHTGIAIAITLSFERDTHLAQQAMHKVNAFSSRKEIKEDSTVTVRTIEGLLTLCRSSQSTDSSGRPILREDIRAGILRWIHKELKKCLPLAVDSVTRLFIDSVPSSLTIATTATTATTGTLSPSASLSSTSPSSYSKKVRASIMMVADALICNIDDITLSNIATAFVSGTCSTLQTFVSASKVIDGGDTQACRESCYSILEHISRRCPVAVIGDMTIVTTLFRLLDSEEERLVPKLYGALGMLREAYQSRNELLLEKLAFEVDVVGENNEDDIAVSGVKMDQDDSLEHTDSLHSLTSTSLKPEDTKNLQNVLLAACFSTHDKKRLASLQWSRSLFDFSPATLRIMVHLLDDPAEVVHHAARKDFAALKDMMAAPISNDHNNAGDKANTIKHLLQILMNSDFGVSYYGSVDRIHATVEVLECISQGLRARDGNDDKIGGSVVSIKSVYSASSEALCWRDLGDKRKAAHLGDEVINNDEDILRRLMTIFADEKLWLLPEKSASSSVDKALDPQLLSSTGRRKEAAKAMAQTQQVIDAGTTLILRVLSISNVGSLPWLTDFTRQHICPLLMKLVPYMASNGCSAMNVANIFGICSLQANHLQVDDMKTLLISSEKDILSRCSETSNTGNPQPTPYAISRFAIRGHIVRCMGSMAISMERALRQHSAVSTEMLTSAQEVFMQLFQRLHSYIGNITSDLDGLCNKSKGGDKSNDTQQEVGAVFLTRTLDEAEELCLVTINVYSLLAHSGLFRNEMLSSVITMNIGGEGIDPYYRSKIAQPLPLQQKITKLLLSLKKNSLSSSDSNTEGSISQAATTSENAMNAGSVAGTDNTDENEGVDELGLAVQERGQSVPPANLSTTNRPSDATAPTGRRYSHLLSSCIESLSKYVMYTAVEATSLEFRNLLWQLLTEGGMWQVDNMLVRFAVAESLAYLSMAEVFDSMDAKEAKSIEGQICVDGKNLRVAEIWEAEPRVYASTAAQMLPSGIRYLLAVIQAVCTQDGEIITKKAKREQQRHHKAQTACLLLVLITLLPGHAVTESLHITRDNGALFMHLVNLSLNHLSDKDYFVQDVACLCLCHLFHWAKSIHRTEQGDEGGTEGKERYNRENPFGNKTLQERISSEVVATLSRERRAKQPLGIGVGDTDSRIDTIGNNDNNDNGNDSGNSNHSNPNNDRRDNLPNADQLRNAAAAAARELGLNIDEMQDRMREATTGTADTRGVIAAMAALPSWRTRDPDPNMFGVYSTAINVAKKAGDASVVFTILSLIRRDPAFGAADSDTDLLYAAYQAPMTRVDRPKMKRLLPMLFMAKYDPYPSIREVMRSLWDILVTPEYARLVILLQGRILDLLVSSLTSTIWRDREAACLALESFLVRRTWTHIRPRLLRLWKGAMNVLDDIRDSTRLASLGYIKVLCEQIHRACNPLESSLQTVQDCHNLILPLLVEKGLVSPTPEGRGISLGLLIKIIKASKSHLGPWLPPLIESLTQCMSALEPTTLQYMSFHTARLNMSDEELERIRLKMSQESPMQDALQECLQSLTGSSDSSKGNILEVVHDLCNTIVRGVGLATRASAASSLSFLAEKYPLEFGAGVNRAFSEIIRLLIETPYMQTSLRKTFVGTMGAIGKVVQPITLEGVVRQLIHQYNHLDINARDEKAVVVAGCIQQIINRCASSLMDNQLWMQLLVCTYFGLFDSEPLCRECWGAVWPEVLSQSGAGNKSTALLRGLLSILDCSSEYLQDRSWGRRLHGVHVLQDMFKCLSVNDLLSSVASSVQLADYVPISISITTNGSTTATVASTNTVGTNVVSPASKVGRVVYCLLKLVKAQIWNGQGEVLECLSNLLHKCDTRLDNTSKQDQVLLQVSDDTSMDSVDESIGNDDTHRDGTVIISLAEIQNKRPLHEKTLDSAGDAVGAPLVGNSESVHWRVSTRGILAVLFHEASRGDKHYRLLVAKAIKALPWKSIIGGGSNTPQNTVKSNRDSTLTGAYSILVDVLPMLCSGMGVSPYASPLPDKEGPMSTDDEAASSNEAREALKSRTRVGIRKSQTSSLSVFGGRYSSHNNAVGAPKGRHGIVEGGSGMDGVENETTPVVLHDVLTVGKIVRIEDPRVPDRRQQGIPGVHEEGNLMDMETDQESKPIQEDHIAMAIKGKERQQGWDSPRATPLSAVDILQRQQQVDTIRLTASEIDKTLSLAAQEEAAAMIHSSTEKEQEEIKSVSVSTHDKVMTDSSRNGLMVSIPPSQDTAFHIQFIDSVCALWPQHVRALLDTETSVLTTVDAITTLGSSQQTPSLEPFMDILKNVISWTSSAIQSDVWAVRRAVLQLIEVIASETSIHLSSELLSTLLQAVQRGAEDSKFTKVRLAAYTALHAFLLNEGKSTQLRDSPDHADVVRHIVQVAAVETDAKLLERGQVLQKRWLEMLPAAK